MLVADRPTYVNAASVKAFGPFRLDAVNQCLWRNAGSNPAERILLKPKAFAILRYLVDHAGRLVTRDELLDAVWPDTHVQPDVLKRHVFDIRNELGDDPREPIYIETLSRRGHQFIAPVRNVVPQSAAADTAANSQLVGRDQALAELQECLGLVSKGQRQIVFVTGEAGIGKTALVDEFQRQATTGAPIRIGRGQCVEGYGGKESYYPMLEALGKLCRGPAGEPVLRVLTAEAPTWLARFPSLVHRLDYERLRDEILGATMPRMLREICDAIEMIAAETPLLLILEDLHWTDHSTVDLLSALARGRGGARLMVIGTCRPVDLALAGNPLGAVERDLLVHRLCREVALKPLKEAEIGAYLAREAEGCVPEGLAAALYSHSEGNPMLLETALEHMVGRGLVSREDGRWNLRAAIEEIEVEAPEDLRAMIEIQIGRLSAGELRAMEAASVNGVAFTAALSAHAAGMELEDFEELCESLVHRGLLSRSAGARTIPDHSVSDQYRFVHAVYRDVLYRRQSPCRRAALHRRIGQRLEELYAGSLDEISDVPAHHFEMSDSVSGAVSSR